ncbi:hypothetical protein [Micromonospora sp. WP24]|uniref:hypothetical protein n=1 Tax=Micromonospora sp. WP24 TaxID=2604469 RepID=UPI001651D774
MPAPRRLLQRGDHLDEVTGELLGVAPGEVESPARHHDLAEVTEGLGEVGVLSAGRLALRSGARDAAVRSAAEEHGVRTHLVVVVGHDTVERDEHPRDDQFEGVNTSINHWPYPGTPEMETRRAGVDPRELEDADLRPSSTDY